MRLLVVGAGATGGYFGGRLAQAGRDVSFLVRQRRAEQLRRDGLRIVSPHGDGDATITPSVIESAELHEPFDAVLLAVKAYSIDAALDDVAPAIGPETMILPVLNGMRHTDVIAARFATCNLIGGVCKVATVLRDDGAIGQLAPLQELAYGEMDGAASTRIAALHRFMSDAGFDARVSERIEHEMWQKWVLLAALGGATCLMRGNVGEITKADGGPAFANSLLAEIAGIAAACGQPMPAAFMQAARSMLIAEASTMTSSMYRDLERGQRIEADQIIGDLLARARRLHVAAPLLGAVWTHLQVYQARLAP